MPDARIKCRDVFRCALFVRYLRIGWPEHCREATKVHTTASSTVLTRTRIDAHCNADHDHDYGLNPSGIGTGGEQILDVPGPVVAQLITH